MKFKISLQLFVFSLLYNKTFSIIVYFKFQIFNVDDYIDNIISSEGTFTPTNPIKYYNLDHTFNFNEIKHNLKKPLCIQLVNIYQPGYFAFKYASINEYDITVINYENYYYCDNCNRNTPKKFEIITKYIVMEVRKYIYYIMEVKREKKDIIHFV